MLASVVARAQQSQQPPPFTAPNPPTPAAPNAPGQQSVPGQQQPNAPPDAPLPQPDRTTVDRRDLEPLSIQSPAPAQPSANVQRAANDSTRPQAESPSPLHTRILAAVESRDYQQQLLQAETDKFAVGASTNFMIVQDEAYLAQARSTEVAARSDWMKAQLSLQRALGSLLETNNIVLEDAIRERVQ
jgi:hypothetical protein